MKIQIITNKHSGKGLTVDGELLKSVLESVGHQVNIVDFFHPSTGSNHNLNIFCEVVAPEFFRFSDRNWWIPNIEWASQDYMQYIRNFEKILCKTQDAYNVISQYSNRAEHTGFIAMDRYKPDVKKERRFIHNYGNSISRNTDSIINAWDYYRIEHPLLIVGDGHRSPETPIVNRNVRGISYVDRLSDEELTQQLNQCQFVLLPSQYEGFGCGLNEARSCGGLVISTDAPPMNEFPSPVKVSVSGTFKRCLATMNYVSPESVKNAVHSAWLLSDEELRQNEIASREEFLKRNTEFKEKLLKLF